MKLTMNCTFFFDKLQIMNDHCILKVFNFIIEKINPPSYDKSC